MHIWQKEFVTYFLSTLLQQYQYLLLFLSQGCSADSRTPKDEETLKNGLKS